ncbi:MAG TPA: glycine cleavage T C-terminal barrel domain-containing protein [Vicinamibacterales bacterium]
MVPSISIQAYDAATQRAGLVERTEYSYIVVSGKDRASYLQGLLTNDITALGPGQGCYAAYLTAQGRMIADLWVYELGDVILLRVLRDVKSTVLERLDQFVFSEDVKLGDVTDAFMAIAVVGPKAATFLSSVLEITDATLDTLSEHGNLRASFQGESAIVLRITDFGEPALEILIEAIAFESLRAALRRAGAVVIDDATAEALRIEAGVPKFHQDMDEETIPLEAGIESRAISLTKGCYVGQEVIIRVLHRGHGRVARKLVGLVKSDDVMLTRGAIVHADGKEIGEVTSAAWSPALQHPIAMAYVHRDFVAPGTHVTVEGADAEVVALPFRSSANL